MFDDFIKSIIVGYIVGIGIGVLVCPIVGIPYSLSHMVHLGNCALSTILVNQYAEECVENWILQF